MSGQIRRESCYFCGNEDTEVHEEHHIVPRRFGGSDRDENLVQLCPTCHQKIERLYGTRFYNTLGVGEGVPAGDELARELGKVDPSYDECESVIDAGVEFKYELLEQLGLYPARYLCPGCYNITLPVTNPDEEGAPSCPRCGASRGAVSFESNILSASFIESRESPNARGDYSG